MRAAVCNFLLVSRLRCTFRLDEVARED